MSLVRNNLEHIPNGTFYDIGNLSILMLEKNHFRVMPVNNICLLKRLGILNLASNKLATINFDECFKDLETLYYVDLSDNPVMELSFNNFYGLRNSPILQLYLNKIEIQILSTETFQYLPHLKVLSLQDNKLTSLPSDVFDNLVNMTTLILSGNKLNSIPSASIIRLSHLEVLDLAQNRLRNNTLGSEIHNMPHLHNMILSENRLNYLSNASFSSLAYSKKFGFLVLKSASLKVIEANAFLPLKFLTKLTLNNNPLDASMLEQAFYGLRFSVYLTELGLDTTNLTDINASTFRYLANTSLVNLLAQGCLITVIPSETFKFLPKLQVLSLSGNKVHTTEKNAFKYLNELVSLDLSHNYLSSIPNGNDVGLNTLKRLTLKRNSIRETVQQYSLRGYNQLEYLSLVGNSIRRISPRAFLYMPSLLGLYLSNNKISSLDNDAFVGLGNLTHLILSGNNIYDFEVTFFQHTPNIQRLDLSRNNFFTVKIKDDIAKLFKPLRNLKQLTMSSTRLHHLPDSTFHNLTQLTVLTLSNNQLSKWTPGLFRDQTNLKVLSLGRNKISTIYKDVIMELTSLEQLDVSNNSFLCNCELQWFTNWIQSGVFVYFSNLDKTTCGSPAQKHGKRLMDLNMDWECMSLRFYYVYWSMLFCYAVTVTVLTMVYRLRFYLKYWRHLVRAQKAMKEEMAEKRFVFDAFVSYTRNDQKWVIKELLQKVEREANVKLCLHQRNWFVGSSVPGNILNSIKKSRKTVLVLSNAYARSYWCELEMAIAQQKILTSQRDVVVPIMLEPIQKKYVTEQMVCLFATQTCIKWPQRNQRKQRRFWKRLIKTLRPPKQQAEYDEDNKDFLTNFR